MTSPPSLAAYFCEHLAAAGWEQTKRTTANTMFRRGRNLLSVGVNPDGSVSWNAFPSPPPPGKNSSAAFTGPFPVPVGSFSIDGKEPHLTVSLNVVDRSGKFVKEPFFNGDKQAVLHKLLEESMRRVDAFIRSVEAD
jgi:hypothetical protein